MAILTNSERVAMARRAQSAKIAVTTARAVTTQENPMSNATDIDDGLTDEERAALAEDDGAGEDPVVEIKYSFSVISPGVVIRHQPFGSTPMPRTPGLPRRSTLALYGSGCLSKL